VNGGAAHSDEERRAIVFAAYECIAALGIDGLRPRHVTAEAAISEPRLRRHYPTKRDLVAAVLGYLTRQLEATMPEDGTPTERLRHHLESLGRMISERPVLFTVLAELDLRARHDALVRSVVEREERGWRAALAALFRAGAEQEAWADGITEEAAVELVVAAVKGVRIAPASAGIALSQLERLLVRPNRRPDAEAA
jgi:AcrR family transcriptional regulator